MTTQGANGCQLEKTLAEGMRYMLENKIATDVCIEVGAPDREAVTFRAHKFVLMSRSEVFEAMFSIGMAECSGPEAKVRVEDIDPDTFKELMNYLYCEKTSVCSASAVYLLYAAKKYMLPKLVRECCRCLLESLDVNNVIHLLEQSLHLDEEELKSACLKLISANAKAVLTGDEIQSAFRQTLEAIIESDTIAVPESMMYEATVNWAKHQLQGAMPGENPTDLQIRETLGELLYKIRFPIMKPTEFVEITAENNLLTAEEKETVYCFLVNKKKHSQLKFSTERRRIGNELWIDRTVKTETRKWFKSPNLEAISFVTNEDVLLTGIGLYKGFRAAGYDADVELLQSIDSVFKKSVTVPFGVVSAVFKLVLDQPIVITAGVMYSVKALSRGRIGHCGLTCRAVCAKDTVTFTFYKHSESELTTEAYGQIPRLYFCFL